MASKEQENGEKNEILDETTFEQTLDDTAARPLGKRVRKIYKMIREAAYEILASRSSRDMISKRMLEKPLKAEILTLIVKIWQKDLKKKLLVNARVL